jgi:hypothetical protein
MKTRAWLFVFFLAPLACGLSSGGSHVKYAAPAAVAQEGSACAVLMKSPLPTGCTEVTPPEGLRAPLNQPMCGGGEKDMVTAMRNRTAALGGNVVCIKHVDDDARQDRMVCGEARAFACTCGHNQFLDGSDDDHKCP